MALKVLTCMVLLLAVAFPSPSAINVKPIRTNPNRGNRTRADNVAPPGAGLAWPLKPAGNEVVSLISAPDKLYVPMPHGIVAAVIFWGAGMCAIWACPWLSWELKQQGADRLLSAVHAIVATICGLIAELGTFAACQVGRSWMITAIQMTIGYMIVDAISMLIVDVWKKWRKADLLMFAHHAYIILFFTLGGYVDMGVWFFVIGMINEASSPLLSMLWILKYRDPQSRWLMPVGVAFTAIFFLCRIIFIPISYYQFAALGLCDGFTVVQSTLSATVKPCYAFIYSLNCYWFYRTVVGAIKAMKGKPEDAMKEG